MRFRDRSSAAGRRCLFAFACLFVAGCGGVVQLDSGLDEDPGQPLDPPQNAPPGDGPGAVLVVSKIDMGARDAEGYYNEDGWRTIGFNLDHQVSSVQGPGTCDPPASDQSYAFGDGEDGIDNTFGRILGYLFFLEEGPPPNSLASALALGGPSVLFDLRDIGASAAYSTITASMYASAPQSSPPHYDGTDSVPVSSESVDGGVESPKVHLVESYLADDGEHGTWVARGEGVLPMILPFGDAFEPGRVFRLSLHDPVVSMKLSADRRHGTGTLAGRAVATEILKEMDRFVLAADPSFCGGTSTIESLNEGVGRGVDIRVDAKSDPSLPCDAFSVGLRFEAEAALLGPVAPPAAEPPIPCSP
ncbi:MAG: hypothetical protein U0441_03730 [Polyangiaceae bacterium]